MGLSESERAVIAKAYHFWKADPENWSLASKAVFNSGKFNSVGQGPERERATVKMYERMIKENV